MVTEKSTAYRQRVYSCRPHRPTRTRSLMPCLLVATAAAVAKLTSSYSPGGDILILSLAPVGSICPSTASRSVQPSLQKYIGTTSKGFVTSEECRRSAI